MEGNDEIDTTDDVVKFCVSWTTINVITSATDKFVAAWNAHTIPGIRRGVPNALFGHAPQTTCLPTTVIPTTAEFSYTKMRVAL